MAKTAVLRIKRLTTPERLGQKGKYQVCKAVMVLFISGGHFESQIEKFINDQEQIITACVVWIGQTNKHLDCPSVCLCNNKVQILYC